MGSDRSMMMTSKTWSCVSSHRRSEEHTSELQLLAYLVCRLLLEKKKKNKTKHTIRAKTYHSIQHIDDELGTAFNVQSNVDRNDIDTHRTNDSVLHIQIISDETP